MSYAILDSRDKEELQKSINENKENVSKLSEEKVTNPSTGEVGQILEIESVDENGKPLTYKAVNKPTGGEVSDEQIAEAVENYLTENPIEGGSGADGKDGVGISSVEQTTTSTEDGGVNIVTVTKTDGTSSTFQVLNGSKGSQGEQGEKGEQGEQGIQGEKGEKGDIGATGATGKTAYQYAQDGGYTGTEEEFAEKLAQENPNEIMLITESELSNMTQEELSDEYKNGTRALIVTDNYENLVPTAISANGGIYNGCGYMNGIRLTSSGAIDETTREGCVTGFIPFLHGKKINIYGSKGTIGASGLYVATYDNAFTLIGIGEMSSFEGITVEADENNLFKFTINATESIFTNASYIRVSLNPCEGKDVIIWCGGETA